MDETKKNDKQKNTKDNVLSIDDRRVKRLEQRGNLQGIIDEYEKLRVKFIYDKELTKEEAIKLITLCKYLMKNAPSEAYRLSCEYLYEKYMKRYGL